MDEFSVKLAHNAGKKHNVFKLHKDDQVTWSEAKMRRENDFQPWQIKIGNGRQARRFKAIKEGGIGENASYFVFYKPKDTSDTYEVCPIDEWYNMSATQRYKTLTAEEAEQKFEQRNKTLNFFSVMHLKKNGENGDEGGPMSSGHDSKAFKVSELDDWDESGDDFDDDGENGENGEDDEGAKRKQRKKKSAKKEKDDPEDAPDEGKEDSDEGDFEQREVDYMSDTSSESSASEAGKRDEDDVRGIAEEEALRDLLSTDDEDDEAENPQQKTTNNKFGPGSITTADLKPDPYADNSDDSSDSDDYDVDDDKMDSMFMKKDLPSQLVKLDLKSESTSSSNEPGGRGSNMTGGASGSASSISGSGQKQQSVANKRKAVSDAGSAQTQPQPPPKRLCPIDPPSSPAMGQEKVIEDLIKKYLGRKPMTLKNLLKDIKSKLKRLSGANAGMDNDLVSTIATIIKRLNPERQKINDVTYFSLKAD